MKQLAVEPVPTPITPAGLDVRERGLGHACFFSFGGHTCLATLKGGKNTLFRV